MLWRGWGCHKPQAQKWGRVSISHGTRGMLPEPPSLCLFNYELSTHPLPREAGTRIRNRRCVPGPPCDPARGTERQGEPRSEPLRSAIRVLSWPATRGSGGSSTLRESHLLRKDLLSLETRLVSCFYP